MEEHLRDRVVEVVELLDEVELPEEAVKGRGGQRDVSGVERVCSPWVVAQAVDAGVLMLIDGALPEVEERAGKIRVLWGLAVLPVRVLIKGVIPRWIAFKTRTPLSVYRANVPVLW